MKIITHDAVRTLVKDDNTMYNINDNEIVKYTGLYYKKEPNSIVYTEIEATFIGKIDCMRFAVDYGITGIYIHPLYIYYNDRNDPCNKKWHKIINYKLPKNKYFFYPHLLMLPGTYHHFQPLIFLHTVENISLDKFVFENELNMGEMEL